jgi:Ankyrin repeats (3 copies)
VKLLPNVLQLVLLVALVQLCCFTAQARDSASSARSLTQSRADESRSHRYVNAVQIYAAEGNHGALRLLLVDSQIAPLKDGQRGELLAALIEYRNTDAVTAAVRAGINPNQIVESDYEGEPLRVTALNYAISVDGAHAVAERLIALGADVSRVVSDDNPPLLSAVSAAQYGLAQSVLQRGADPNSINPVTGATALMVLLAREKDATKAIEVARKLKSFGARINATTHRGFTALMFAADTGQTETVKWLLDNGADCWQQSVAGETALAISGRSLNNSPGVDAALQDCMNKTTRESKSP